MTRATGFDRAFVYVMVTGMMLDRVTKLIAEAALKNQPSITVIDGVFDLHYAHNDSALFGLGDRLPNVLRVIATRILPGLFAVALAVLYVRTPELQRTLRTGLVFILTGTIANLIDRFKHGGVIDFLNLRLGEQSAWLTINVADLYVAVGIGLLAWHMSAAPSSRPLERP